MILSTVLGVFAGLSLVLMIWQVAVALRFPLHRRNELRATDDGAAASPRAAGGGGVTVLKPLKGADDQTYECLRSWLCRQYPGPVQVIFGVASADDPVCAVLRALKLEFPGDGMEWVLCPERLGANAKVSQLLQMERAARHEIFCISDADVWAPSDFLAEAVAVLREPGVGLAHCFYRLTNQETWAMRWEAMAVNVDFWSQVLQSASLKPVDFALGAAMVTTRENLKAIGGFHGLVDHLADDYQLGHRIARAGRTVAFCPVVVECRSGRLTFGEVWMHQLRWARTIRVCQPLPFFASILSNASFWPLLWLAVTPSALSAAGAALCLGYRLWSARYLEQRMAAKKTASAWGMPVVKDLLQVAIWAMAFVGRQVSWRGIRYHVDADGQLTPLLEGDASSEPKSKASEA